MRAMEVSDLGEPRPWPGKIFTMDSAGGKALLGSPNGLGVTFFPLQHKAISGQKYY